MTPRLRHRLGVFQPDVEAGDGIEAGRGALARRSPRRPSRCRARSWSGRRSARGFFSPWRLPSPLRGGWRRSRRVGSVRQRSACPHVERFLCRPPLSPSATSPPRGGRFGALPFRPRARSARPSRRSGRSAACRRTRPAALRQNRPWVQRLGRIEEIGQRAAPLGRRSAIVTRRRRRFLSGSLAMPQIWEVSAKMERAEWRAARDETRLLTQGCQERCRTRHQLNHSAKVKNPAPPNWLPDLIELLAGEHRSAAPDRARSPGR